MNEQKNNGRGIFYGVIGIATLVVAIIGATFAYFTATKTINNAFTGNMATITFDLVITKMTTVDEEKEGMIPMSNSMVQAAVNNPTSKGGSCVDNNGNAVCQIYKATVTNTGSATLFLDGYITLTGGSGTSTDATGKWVNITTAADQTTMRWAQVFPSGDVYTTIGKSTTGATYITADTDIKGVTSDWDTLAATDANAGTSDKDENGNIIATYRHNTANIINSFTDATAKGAIQGNSYDIINRNYIRISDRATGGYTRTGDITSALVFNQFLTAAGGTKDSQDFYFVVWLSETGYNQTAKDTLAGDPAASGKKFFSGNVVFNSAQGSEVTATFSGFAAVQSNNA